MACFISDFQGLWRKSPKGKCHLEVFFYFIVIKQRNGALRNYSIKYSKDYIPKMLIDMDTLFTKLCIAFTLVCQSHLAYNQSIGYNKLIYVPESENYVANELPKTPAIVDFTKKLKNQIKGQIKDLKKKDQNFEIKKQEIIKEYCFGIQGSLRAIYEVESLKVLSEEEAIKSLYHFLDCWAGKNFKSKKKNFCMGCWEQHIERERFYKERVATIYD
jgi:hypothetical protein